MRFQIRSRFLWLDGLWVRGAVDTYEVPTEQRGTQVVSIAPGNFSLAANDYVRLEFYRPYDGGQLTFRLQYNNYILAPFAEWEETRLWTRVRYQTYFHDKPVEGCWFDYRTVDASHDVMSLVDSRLSRIQKAIAEPGHCANARLEVQDLQ